MADFILQETNFLITLEDGTGFVLLEIQTVPTDSLFANVTGNPGINVPWYPHREFK